MLADILTDFPEKFADRKDLWLSTEDGSTRREYRLQEHWLHKGRVVLKFPGIDSIADAETLIGLLVQIPTKDRSKLEPGTFYVTDLVGSTLVDCAPEQRREIGVVEDVQQGAGSAPLLIVRTAGQEYEIPFAAEYIERFDAAAKTLEMKLPQGMLEVNAPLSESEKREHNKQNRLR